MFLLRESAKETALRVDLPTIQNERYYSFGVYNDSKEPFELAVLAAVRGEDEKLRLLYFASYDL